MAEEQINNDIEKSSNEIDFPFEEEEGGVTAPQGFRATGVSCGLKEKDVATKDIGLILAENPCVTASAFTNNRVQAAPVLFDKTRVANAIQAVVVNSGNANCLTGKQGEDNAAAMAKMAEEHLSLSAGSVMVCSTGVIGKQLKMDRVTYGIERLANTIKHESSYKNFSSAIMTTDMKMKNVAYSFDLSGKKVTIGISGKGAGMIKPDMDVLHATMLVFITTDCNIGKPLLEEALVEALSLSFNRISVDNDTSTNDTVILMANGMAENDSIISKGADYERFTAMLTKACQDIAKLMVKDGEGATKLVKIEIAGAKTDGDAVKIARSIADSYLVKTAMFGQSPNWGRILAALGYSGAEFDIQKVILSINGLVIFENGDANRSNEGRANGEMIQHEITLTLSLGMGNGEYFMWTSDLSYDYVKINAHYLT